MADTLIIIPTKDRPEYINCLIQNLIIQDGEFDIFIADMSDDPNILTNNWLLRNGLERLRYMGHKYYLSSVIGINQLVGYNMGVKYAVENGYKYCMGGDDDIIYERGWIDKGRKHMINDERLGICAGITLIPSFSIESQSIGTYEGPPPEVSDLPEFSGTLAEGNYAHCIYVPTDKIPRYYERVYGGFFFRTDDAVKVGGFPDYLSPLGFAGEGIFESAILFSGKKMMVDPNMISWHYQANYGGLRFDSETREKYVKEDLEKGRIMMDRRLPTVKLP